MIDKEKQINEIINTIEDVNEIYVRQVDEDGFSDIGYSDRYAVNKKVAETLYNAGYRKMDAVRIYEMQMKNGEIDMKIGSDHFHLFLWCVIQTFKQNGSKNFFTTTVECGENYGERYAITIQKIGGKSPGEELNEVRKNTAFEILNSMANVGSYDSQPLRNFDFFKKLCEKYGVEIKG